MVYIWADKNILSILFSLGLFLTFPNLFLLERGNSDLFIVLFWSLAYFCFSQKKSALTGVFLAISVFSKLYPVYALIVLAAFYNKKSQDQLKVFKAFIISAICIALISPFLWFEYLVDVLPGWSSAKTPIYNLAHSLKSLPYPIIGSGIFYFCFLFWIMAALKAGEKRLGWIFAGGLALSTFHNGVSFDYNLVTVFPLAILGFNYFSTYFSTRSNNKLLASCFLLLFFTVFGSRQVFINFEIYPHIRLYILGLILMIIPFTFFDLKHEVKRVQALAKFYFLKYS
jgi:hypothetical protein